METHSIQCLAVTFLISINFALASTYGHTCYVDEYITESYFKKYDSFIEREFDNFIANKIPLGLCKVVEHKNQVLVNGLSRSVIGEGSHRWLSSSIRLKFPHELKPGLSAHSCEVVVIDKLPSGVFTDPFELQHLVQRGVFTDAAVFGDTNLELPSFRSNQTIVEIHMTIDAKALSGDEDESEVVLKVPLHARYQPLGLGFSRVEFGVPNIFTCCSSSERDVPKTRCQSTPMNLIPGKKASPVIWEIPCGNKEHAAVVSAVTFGSADIFYALLELGSRIGPTGRARSLSNAGGFWSWLDSAAHLNMKKHVRKG